MLNDILIRVLVPVAISVPLSLGIVLVVKCLVDHLSKIGEDKAPPCTQCALHTLNALDIHCCKKFVNRVSGEPNYCAMIRDFECKGKYFKQGKESLWGL